VKYLKISMFMIISTIMNWLNCILKLLQRTWSKYSREHLQRKPSGKTGKITDSGPATSIMIVFAWTQLQRYLWQSIW